MSIGQEKKNALNVRLAGYPVKYAEILKKRPDTAVVYPGERKNDLMENVKVYFLQKIFCIR